MPMIISKTESTKAAMNVVDIAVFISLFLPAPKYWETMTDEPIFEPNAKAMNISVISYEFPTAASASAPRNFPATKLSAMLYSCWNSMEPRRGRVKRQIAGLISPTVRSLFITRR